MYLSQWIRWFDDKVLGLGIIYNSMFPPSQVKWDIKTDKYVFNSKQEQLCAKLIWREPFVEKPRNIKVVMITFNWNSTYDDIIDESKG